MTTALKRPNKSFTPREKKLYVETLKKIYNKVVMPPVGRNLNLDSQKQHHIRISKIIVNGRVNPKVKQWLNNSTTSDIVSIDDIPKDLIKQLRYGTGLSKADRRTLAMLRRINNKRAEKTLIKDLSGNEKVLKLSEKKKWLRNKKKYDIRNVDTIPLSVAGYTASQVSKKYNTLTKKKKYTRTLSTQTPGVFISSKSKALINKRNIRINRLIKGTNQGQTTLAHEIGHSFDKLKRNFKKPPQKVINEMKKVAQKLNKPIVPFNIWEKTKKDHKQFSQIPQHVKKYMAYRLQHQELFADAFAFAMYDINYVKRQCPNFYKYLTNKNKGLSNILTKSKKDHVLKIVKVLKKDKKFLERDRKNRKIIKLQQQIKKIKGFKQVGVKRKQKIKSLQGQIRRLK